MGTIEDQITALRSSAGIVALTDADSRGFLHITGSDRERWLNGMATNNVATLAQSQGNYHFFLNAQGRIQGDAYIFRDGDSFLLETYSNQLDTLQNLLDRFIIMDDVQLAPAFEDRNGLSLVGPDAPRLLHDLSLPTPEPLHLAQTEDVLVVAAYAPTVPRYELWASSEVSPGLEQRLLAAGAITVEPKAAEALRILEGTPLYGVDIRDRDLAQETGQDRALHFNKGCYLGQEIVERIRSRGAVHRIFTSFSLDGAIPGLPTALEAVIDGQPKSAGELTSAVSMPGGRTLALGYARREMLERNQPLLYPGGRATPIPLHSKVS